MNKERSESLKKLKDYIDVNKKEYQSTIMKIRDLLSIYDGKTWDIYSEEDLKQFSLSIYYNLLNNTPDHLIMYENNCNVFQESKRRKISLFRSIKIFSVGFLLDLPTYPEIDGYAWNKKIADKLGTNKYFDKDLRDRLLNKEIFVSIFSWS